MPSGVYPPDHKHEKARGLSRNKYNAKGELRPQRKTRSKLAKVQEKLGLDTKKNPAEILGERRGLIGYAIDNYDFDTNISFKTHLQQLLGNDASLLTEQGRDTAEAFRDDYQQHLKTNVIEPRKAQVIKKQYFSEKGMDLSEDAPADMGIPNTIFHKVNKTALNTKINMPTYDIDDPYRIQGDTNTAVKELLNPKGKARVRAKRSDVGIAKGVRLTPYLQTMKNTREALLRAGKGLSSLKNVMTDAKFNVEGLDTDSEDEDYSGPKRYDGRHLDEPLQSIKYEQHASYGRPFPLKDVMTQKLNPRARKLGVLVNEGGSDYEDDSDFDFDTDVYVNTTGAVTYDYDHGHHELDKGHDIEGGDAIDVNQYKAHTLDDFIHGLAFEGKAHPQKEAILGNLKRGKKFELGFDALLNPYMVTLDEPDRDKGKTIKRLGEESKGITPSILPQTPNYFQDEMSKDGNKAVVKNKSLFLLHQGKLYNSDTYNAMRKAQETKQVAFAPKEKEEKVYVGDIDPVTKKERKRAGVKMVEDPTHYDFKTGKIGKRVKEFDTKASNYSYEGAKYGEEDGLKKGGEEGKIKWMKFEGEKHLVIHIGKRGTNPTASGPLPVAGWSKSKVIHMEDGEYRKSFRKYHNKQGYYRNFSDTNKGGKAGQKRYKKHLASLGVSP